MGKKVDKESLMKEKTDIEELVSHLEDEYRKANVSEKNYQELKVKYSQRLDEIGKKLGSKEEISEKKSKGGLLGKLMGKKEKQPEVEQPKEVKEEKPKDEIEVGEVEEMTPEVIEKLAQQVATESGVTPSQEVEGETGEKEGGSKDIEIEKLKVMIDSIREANRATDDTIRTVSEGIGEIRSMVFQTDGSLRETTLKIEKIEDDVSGLRPKEIDKKFREIGVTVEKQQMLMEKLDIKSEDLAKKINQVYEMLKGAGNIENLTELNKEMQKKRGDIKEAIRYIERIASKAEKNFIDLSRNLEEFVVYKSKQEGLDESVRDLIKSVDGINTRIDNLPTKKDLDVIKADIIVLKKQVEEINKVLPVVQARLPETIESVRRERESILLFMDSLQEQVKSGKISIGEYEEIKKKNMKKLADIENKLKKEWEKIEEIVSKGEIPKEVGTSEADQPKKELQTTKEESGNMEKGEASKTVEKKEVPEKMEKKETIPEKPANEEIKKEPEKKEDSNEKKGDREEMVNILKKIREKMK